MVRKSDIKTLHPACMRLKTAYQGELFAVEKLILSRMTDIEDWFRQQWAQTPSVLMSSMDLRHAGFKIATVDTNLFPAGFNNLNPDFLPLCVQALQSVTGSRGLAGKNILLIPEVHTRNPYYAKSLKVLCSLFVHAGFKVHLGHWEQALVLENGLQIEKIERNGARLCIGSFDPCMVILNNDLSAGVPTLLQGIEQPILPSLALGWSNRQKSHHFSHYAAVVDAFSQMLGCDPWWLNPDMQVVDGVDFMAGEGLPALAEAVDQVLMRTQTKYQQYGIDARPFVVVKSDNGTYGMSVMTVYEGSEVLHLNRKKRTKMASSKGGQGVHRLLVQEGIYTFETIPSAAKPEGDEAVAEPVVYMMGPHVVGGFYRVHSDKGVDDNLNSPGMHFEPLAFEKACNIPCCETLEAKPVNRFYVYGVIARLAALAAGRELKVAEGLRS